MNINGFSGSDLTPADVPRLNGQIAAVFNAMSDGQWRTLEEVSEVVERQGIHCRTASASAQLRNLRKPEFGSHVVERKGVGGGLFLYRLVVPAKKTQAVLF